uniref:Uncharacterized protein n=1 Tax=Globodera rostochiensis TaxID=31243 RepID=A0A914GTK0_GLORO
MEEDPFAYCVPPKGRCKSHSFFGIDLHWPKDAGHKNCSTTAPPSKLHHSVSFAVPPTEYKSRTKWKSYSPNLRPNCHHHGSVMSLVMRHKEKHSGAGIAEEGKARRPSTSLPLAIVRAVISPGRKSRYGALSMTSLNDDDSAFLSDCSSSSSASTTDKQSSGFGTPIDCQKGSTDSCYASWPSPSPWKCANGGEFDNGLDGSSVTSIGHLFATNSHMALQKVRSGHGGKGRAGGNGGVLCAEGNTQTYLLSLVAPTDKRVVNIGRNTRDEVIGSGNSHRLFLHNPNNLNPYE